VKKSTIKTAIRKLANEVGLINVTRDAVRKRLGVGNEPFDEALDGYSFTDLIDDLIEEGFEGGEPEVSPSRANPVLRKASILASAIALACEWDYRTITRDDVAERAGVSPTLVTRYFETMDVLRAEIMEAAIRKDIPQLVAQGLAVGDSIAATASQALKRRAGNYILNS